MIHSPLKDGISSVELLDNMGDDLTVVNAARVSYAGSSIDFDGRDAKLIRYLMRNKHGSPFEHVVFQFRIKAPLFVVHQWQRHRMASYNERSGRYVEMQDEFYIADNDMDLIQSYQDAYDLYERKLAEGMPKEKARTCLPNALYTEFWWTVNLRSLLNFLMLRNDSHAQDEIMRYAMAIESIAGSIVPNVISTFEEFGRVAP